MIEDALIEDALSRVEKVRNDLYRLAGWFVDTAEMNKMAEELNQAHHSLQLALGEHNDNLM